MQIHNRGHMYNQWFKETTEKNVQQVTENSLSKMEKTWERDSIQVSQDSLDMLYFMNKLADEEPIRYEKVDAIQRSIDENRYGISGKDVVAKLMEGK